MWYALTAKPAVRSRRESKREYTSYIYEVILSAQSKQLLEVKFNESRQKYPEHLEKYVSAGIKFVEADSPAEAKRKAKNVLIYFDASGKYKFI